MEAMSEKLNDVAALLSRLGAGSDGDDAVVAVDAMQATERVIRAAQAAQARLTEMLRRVRFREGERDGRDERRTLNGVAAEVGLARRLPPRRAMSLVRTAAALQADLPRTAEVFAAGGVSERGVQFMTRELECLSPEDRRRVDTELAPRLPSMSDQQIAVEAASASVHVDPSAAAERIARAESARRVTMRPEPDCMVRISALLPVAAGVALHQELLSTAASAQAAGDERTLGQLMADTLAERVADAGAPGPGSEPEPLAAAAAPRVEVQLVMTDLALLGLSETPAQLKHHGSIPAFIARRLAVEAAAADTAWLRRLYTPPGEGKLVAMESRRRLFPEGLRRFLMTRDGLCRMPWCAAPAREADHVVAFAAGGATTIANGQALCTPCNGAKSEPGWSAEVMEDGAVVTTTPTHHRYRSEPSLLPHEHEVPSDFPADEAGEAGEETDDGEAQAA